MVEGYHDRWWKQDFYYTQMNSLNTYALLFFQTSDFNIKFVGTESFSRNFENYLSRCSLLIQ